MGASTGLLNSIKTGTLWAHWVSRDTRRDGLRGDTLWQWGKREKSTLPMCACLPSGGGRQEGLPPSIQASICGHFCPRHGFLTLVFSSCSVRHRGKTKRIEATMTILGSGTVPRESQIGELSYASNASD